MTFFGFYISVSILYLTLQAEFHAVIALLVSVHVVCVSISFYYIAHTTELPHYLLIFLLFIFPS